MQRIEAVMDEQRYEALSRAMAAIQTRRGAVTGGFLSLLAAAGVADCALSDEISAGKRH